MKDILPAAFIQTSRNTWRDLATQLERELNDERTQVAALVALFKRVLPEPFLCPDCGPFVRADEDGCCAACGADCEIVPFDNALAVYQASQGPAPCNDHPIMGAFPGGSYEDECDGF